MEKGTNEDGTTEVDMTIQANSAAYPLVNIMNSTPYYVCGKVSYGSLLCSNDDYCVDSQSSWTAKSRGVCLVTKITASVKIPNGAVSATPYSSTGTSYSKFAVITSGPDGFAVTRVVQ